MGKENGACLILFAAMRVENMNTYPYRTYAGDRSEQNAAQSAAGARGHWAGLQAAVCAQGGRLWPRHAVCAKYSEELVDWYAVATIDEALSIRRAGVEKPILLFGALQDPEIELAADNRITINSCSLEYSRHVAGGFAAVRQAHGLPH